MTTSALKLGVEEQKVATPRQKEHHEAESRIVAVGFLFLTNFERTEITVSCSAMLYFGKKPLKHYV